MSAAIYCRVSTDEQSEGIDFQLAGGRRWAREHGLDVVNVFLDVGFSGAEWTGRPELNRLHAEARARSRPWDTLVVRAIDRLGRDAVRLTALLVELDELGIRVVEWSTGRAVGVRDADLFLTMFTATRAQAARVDIANTTRAALRERVEAGHVAGGAVYGYRVVRLGSGPCAYEVIGAEAVVVREIYERMGRGESAGAIARTLNERKVPSPVAGKRGSGVWSDGTVRNIARSTRYRGEATWGRIGSRYVGGTRVSEPGKDVVTYAVPPIVDADTWDRAQRGSDAARKRRRLPVQRGHSPAHLLVGHARCAACGGPLGSAPFSSGTGASRHSVPGYRCTAGRRHGRCIAKWSRPSAPLDGAVLDWLARVVITPEIAREALDLARRTIDADARREDPDEVRSCEEIARLERAQRRLVAAIARADVSEDVLVEELERTVAALSAARRRHAAIPRAAQVSPRDLLPDRLAVRDGLEGLLASAVAVDLEALRAVLDAAITQPLQVLPGKRLRLLLDGVGAFGEWVELPSHCRQRRCASGWSLAANAGVARLLGISASSGPCVASVATRRPTRAVEWGWKGQPPPRLEPRS